MEESNTTFGRNHTEAIEGKVMIFLLAAVAMMMMIIYIKWQSNPKSLVADFWRNSYRKKLQYNFPNDGEGQKVIRSDRPLSNTLSVKLYIQAPQCYSICRIIFSLQNNWTLEYVLKCDERSVCTTHFLIATIIGQILSLTWGKSSLPMVRNLTAGNNKSETVQIENVKFGQISTFVSDHCNI